MPIIKLTTSSSDRESTIQEFEVTDERRDEIIKLFKQMSEKKQALLTKHVDLSEVIAAQLLKPRYKVIFSEYPDSEYLDGSIIMLPGDGQLSVVVSPGKEGFVSFPVNQIRATAEWFEQFPRVFERLPWWKYRAIENMPPYIKVITHNPNLSIMQGGTYKVAKWGVFDDKNEINYNQPFALIGAYPFGIKYHALHFEPATKADHIYQSMPIR